MTVAHLIATSREWCEPLAARLEAATGQRFPLATRRDDLTAEGLTELGAEMDTDGFSHAFIERGGMRYEFTGRRLGGDPVAARVTITRSR